jgi:hypothetical protein
MSAFYKVTMNGVCNGKDNRGILYYRTAIDPFGGNFGFGGAIAVADAIQTQVVAPWLGVKPTIYTLQSIDINVYNDTFGLAFQLPYRRSVGQNGAGNSSFTAGMDSNALAVNLRFNLEPVMIGPNRLFAPKRGYLAVGPIPSTGLDDAGKLVNGFGLDFNLGAWKNLADAVSANLLDLDSGSLFFPVRIRSKWVKIAGVRVLKEFGWADVQGAQWDEFSTYRRSRRVTG